MGQFWTKLVVIVHKIARFRTRKPNNTLSALKSIHRKAPSDIDLWGKDLED